jgi:hypothetical protein
MVFDAGHRRASKPRFDSATFGAPEGGPNRGQHRRHTKACAVEPDCWQCCHRAVGDRFTVYFDNELLFEATDRRLTEPGKIALWTKADSVTEFVDLSIEPLP